MQNRPIKQSLKSVAPMFVLAIPVIVIGRFVQSASLVEPVPLWQCPFIAGEVLAFYLWKLVWPVKLGIDYGQTPQWVMQSRIGYFAWMIVLALAMLFARRGIVLLAMVVFVAGAVAGAGICAVRLSGEIDGR